MGTELWCKLWCFMESFNYLALVFYLLLQLENVWIILIVLSENCSRYFSFRYKCLVSNTLGVWSMFVQRVDSYDFRLKRYHLWRNNFLPHVANLLVGLFTLSYFWLIDKFNYSETIEVYKSINIFHWIFFNMATVVELPFFNKILKTKPT